MGITHLLYIPLMMVIGIAVGWALGGRSAQAETDDMREELDKLRKAAAARRLASKGKKKAPASDQDADSSSE